MTSILLFGLLMGMRHTFEADNIVAMASLSTRWITRFRSNRRVLTVVSILEPDNTVLALIDVQVEVIADAVSSRTQENKRYRLHKMQLAGAALTTTEMCLFELVADCKKPEFRQILELVK